MKVVHEDFAVYPVAYSSQAPRVIQVPTVKIVEDSIDARVRRVVAELADMVDEDLVLIDAWVTLYVQPTEFAIALEEEFDVEIFDEELDFLIFEPLTGWIEHIRAKLA